MQIDSPDALREWLTSTLEPICDADPGALAKYVMALLKKDKPEQELKDFCIEQLDVFLQNETQGFVDSVFQAVNSKSYIPSEKPAGNKNSGSGGQQGGSGGSGGQESKPTIIISADGTSSSSASAATNKDHQQHHHSSSYSSSKGSSSSSNSNNNASATSKSSRDRGDGNRDRRSGSSDHHRRGGGSDYHRRGGGSGGESSSSRYQHSSSSRRGGDGGGGVADTVVSGGGGGGAGETASNAVGGGVITEVTSSSAVGSKRRQISPPSSSSASSRGGPTAASSSSADEKRSRLSDPSSSSTAAVDARNRLDEGRGRDRSPRDRRGPSSRARSPVSGGRGGGNDRPSSYSSSNRGGGDDRKRRPRTRSRSPRDRSPPGGGRDRRRSKDPSPRLLPTSSDKGGGANGSVAAGTTESISAQADTTSGGGKSDAVSAADAELDAAIKARRSHKRARCRDYDEKGYCMSGDRCPFDHGPDPVVVDDSALPRMIGYDNPPPPVPPGAVVPPSVAFNLPPPGYAVGNNNPPPPGVDGYAPSPSDPKSGKPPTVPTIAGDINEAYNPDAPAIVPSTIAAGGDNASTTSSSVYSYPPPAPPTVAGSGGGGPYPPPPIHHHQYGQHHAPPPPRPPQQPGGYPIPPPGMPPPNFQNMSSLSSHHHLPPGMPHHPSNMQQMPPGAYPPMHLQGGPSGGNLRTLTDGPGGGRGGGMNRGGGGRGGGRGGFIPHHLRGGGGGGGPTPARFNADNKTLEIRKVPPHQNNIVKLNEHFQQFGQITNIQVRFEGDPEAALITFATKPQATNAYKSTSPILNNRFIKVFWHNATKLDDHGNPIEEPNKPPTSSSSSNPPVIPSRGALSKRNNNNPSGATAGNSGAENENKENPMSKTSHRLPANHPGRGGGAAGGYRAMGPITDREMAIAKRKAKKREKEQILTIFALQKKKTDLLVKSMQSQRDLAARMETNTDPKKKRELKEMFEALYKNNITLQKELGELNTKLKQLTAPPPTSRSKEQLEKEKLDVELEIIGKMQEGEDTAPLQMKLSQLKNELVNLPRQASGGPTVPTAGATGGPLSGSRRRKSSETGPGGGKRQRSLMMSDKKLDKRPKNLVISGFTEAQRDLITKHLEQFGEMTDLEFDTKGENNSYRALVTYKSRQQAETALELAEDIDALTDKLVVSWGPNPNALIRKASTTSIGEAERVTDVSGGVSKSGSGEAGAGGAGRDGATASGSADSGSSQSQPGPIAQRTMSASEMLKSIDDLSSDESVKADEEEDDDDDDEEEEEEREKSWKRK